MKALHASLAPKTNVILVIAEGVAVALLFIFYTPRIPLSIAAAGAALGAIAGVMQHLSFSQASNGFLDAASLMDVRRALKGTLWGSRFIFWIYFSKVILVVLAIVVIRSSLFNVLFGYVAGYISFMFIRELITLRDIFALNRLISNGPKYDPKKAA